MNNKIRPLLLSLCLVAAAAAPALADNWDNRGPYHYPAPRVAVAPPPYAHYAPVMTEFQLRRTLRIHGFHNVHDVRLGRGVYFADARDNWGRPVELTVNAFDGRVLNVRPRWH
jgi:hypothetical protein